MLFTYFADSCECSLKVSICQYVCLPVCATWLCVLVKLALTSLYVICASGYDQVAAIRGDPALCFLEKCGPVLSEVKPSKAHSCLTSRSSAKPAVGTEERGSLENGEEMAGSACADAQVADECFAVGFALSDEAVTDSISAEPMDNVYDNTIFFNSSPANSMLLDSTFESMSTVCASTAELSNELGMPNTDTKEVITHSAGSSSQMVPFGSTLLNNNDNSNTSQSMDHLATNFASTMANDSALPGRQATPSVDSSVQPNLDKSSAMNSPAQADYTCSLFPLSTDSTSSIRTKSLPDLLGKTSCMLRDEQAAGADQASVVGYTNKNDRLTLIKTDGSVCNVPPADHSGNSCYLPAPSSSDLRLRFRRLIAAFQRQLHMDSVDKCSVSRAGVVKGVRDCIGLIGMSVLLVGRRFQQCPWSILLIHQCDAALFFVALRNLRR